VIRFEELKGEGSLEFVGFAKTVSVGTELEVLKLIEMASNVADKKAVCIRFDLSVPVESSVADVDGRTTAL
jgi:hypothetical protein